MQIEGTWRAVARQSVAGETPFRQVKKGKIADLIIESGGKGHTFRKTLLGKSRNQLTWSVIDADGTYLIDVENGFVTILARIRNGRLFGVWDTDEIPNIAGMSVIYEKIK